MLTDIMAPRRLERFIPPRLVPDAAYPDPASALIAAAGDAIQSSEEVAAEIVDLLGQPGPPRRTQSSAWARTLISAEVSDLDGTHALQALAEQFGLGT